MNGYIVARVVCTRVFVSLFLSAEHSKLNICCFVFPPVSRENVYAVKCCDNNRNDLIQYSKRKQFGILFEELREIVYDRFISFLSEVTFSVKTFSVMNYLYLFCACSNSIVVELIMTMSDTICHKKSNGLSATKRLGV